MSITLNGSTGITTPDIDSAAAPDLDASNFTNLPVSVPLFGTGETVTASKTLTSADDKKFFNCTSSVVLTLPTPVEGLVFGIAASTAGSVSFVTASASTKVGSYAGSTLIEAGNSAIITCDGTNWAVLGGSGKIIIKLVQFEESGTYTPSGPVAFLACVTGSTAASLKAVNWRKAGSGGGGYSEKFFSGSLASSYSVVVGQGGPVTGAYDSSTTARRGGTTTFDTISITSSAVPKGASSSTLAATAGGVGSGGDFNATGGTGSRVTSNNYGSSGGGAATRAGNGGNAGTSNSSGSGGSGGTGGNNGVSGKGAGGLAATSEASGVYDLAILSNPVFEAGKRYASTYGENGASSKTIYTDTVSGDTFEIGHVSAGSGVGGERRTSHGGKAGQRGHVTIVEFYA